MSRLTDQQVAEIKGASEDGYSVGEIATHHRISKSTVHRIITTGYRAEVAPAMEYTPPARRRLCPVVISEDGALLRSRGLTCSEAAQVLGVSRRTLLRYLP